MKQPKFTIQGQQLVLDDMPPGTTVHQIPGALAKPMLDYRLHANDLDQAIQAILRVKTDTKDFAIENVALFSTALVFYFRCFKGSNSRVRLRPEEIFDGISKALDGHKFFEAIRDKHVVHDENNYFIRVPFVTVRPGQNIREDDVITLIAQAGIDRDPGYVQLLKELAMHAKRWAERAADEATRQVATILEAIHRPEISSWPPPTIATPVRGDESKKR